MENKHIDKGLTGMSNLGNTCYINSVIQIISNTHELGEYLINVDKLRNVNEHIITKEWIDLYKLMWSKNVIISPNRFIKLLKETARKLNHDMFSEYSQQDATEFFYFFTDCIHTSLNLNDSLTEINSSIKTNKTLTKYISKYNKTECSIVKKTYNLFILEEYFHNDKMVIQKIEPTMMLDVPIPIINNKTGITLETCLDYYFKNENLEGENAWYDEKTKQKKDVIKKTKIVLFPPVLIIHIKRWDYKLKKNNKVIEYDKNVLDMKKYTDHNIKNTKYSLFGIINHEGNIFGGHYYSYIKNENNKWYNFNDTSVKEIKNENSIVNKHNYCLFYRKIK